jgi:RNase P/RNase MRP subunit POP5
MTTQASLRYLVIQVEWGAQQPAAAAAAAAAAASDLDPAAASPSDLFAALRSTHQELFGDAGWGAVASALAVPFYSAASRLAVVRCPAAQEEAVRASLALTRAVRRRAVALHALQCASTVRCLREALARVTRGVAGALRGAAGAQGSSSSSGSGEALLGEAFFAALEREAEDCL